MTKADYRAALKEIESLMTAKANTPEGNRLDVLATLVEAHERTLTSRSLPSAGGTHPRAGDVDSIEDGGASSTSAAHSPADGVAPLAVGMAPAATDADSSTEGRHSSTEGSHSSAEAMPPRADRM